MLVLHTCHVFSAWLVVPCKSHANATNNYSQGVGADGKGPPTLTVSHQYPRGYKLYFFVPLDFLWRPLYILGMGEVVWLSTSEAIPPDRVLSGALEARLDTVLVIGKGQNGDLYAAASTGDAGEIFLLLKRAELLIIENIKKD